MGAFQSVTQSSSKPKNPPPKNEDLAEIAIVRIKRDTANNDDVAPGPEPPELPRDIVMQQLFEFCQPRQIVAFLRCTKRMSGWLNSEDTWQRLYLQAKRLGRLEPLFGRLQREPTQNGSWKERFMWYYPPFSLIRQAKFAKATAALTSNPQPMVAPNTKRNRTPPGYLCSVSILNGDSKNPLNDIALRACGLEERSDISSHLSLPAAGWVGVVQENGSKIREAILMEIQQFSPLLHNESDPADILRWSSSGAFIVVFDPYDERSSQEGIEILEQIRFRLSTVKTPNDFKPFICCVANVNCSREQLLQHIDETNDERTDISPDRRVYLSISDAEKFCLRNDITFLGDWSSIAAGDFFSDSVERFRALWSRFLTSYLEHIAENYKLNSQPKRRKE